MMGDQEYYFEYLKRTERFPQSLYHKAKHDMVSRMFKLLKPRALVLDAGCGIGNVTAKYCKDHFIVGIDEQPSSIEYCSKNCKGKYIQSSLYNIPFGDNVFDLILFLDVIEHLADPHIALRELARVLKPEGRILVCTMNYSSPFWLILEHTWHRFFGGRCKPYSRDVHPTPYTEKILRQHCNAFFKEIRLEKRIMGMELFYTGKK
jgi:ubiquinone/menaquinone biosynthesis C-methylase UbiE